MGIEGDFEKLQRYILNAGDTYVHRKSLAKAMADWIDVTVQESFWKHEDPYGEVWPDRKEPDRYSNPLMVNTATLMTGFVESYSAEGVVVSNAVPYARYHQWGEDHPFRKMLPEDDTLGEWYEPLREIALDQLEHNFGLDFF